MMEDNEKDSYEYKYFKGDGNDFYKLETLKYDYCRLMKIIDDLKKENRRLWVSLILLIILLIICIAMIGAIYVFLT